MERRTGRPILLFQTMDSVTSIFLLHRNPDRAMVILVRLFTIYTVIPFSRCIPAKFIVRIARKPLFENLCVQALQCLRDRANAVKYSPITSWELIDHHSFGNFASGILTSHKITEFSLSDIIDASQSFRISPFLLLHNSVLFPANLNLLIHNFKLLANHFCMFIKCFVHRSKFIRQKAYMNHSPVFQRPIAFPLFKSMFI